MALAGVELATQVYKTYALPSQIKTANILLNLTEFY